MERLEERRLLAIDMTPEEQLLVELINRARANPAAEAALYGIDLSDGFAPGSVSPHVRPPLAPHSALISAAGAHSQAMIDNNFFAHTNPFTGTGPSDRAMQAGYGGGAGENIAYNTGGVTVAHRNLFRSPGHRVNMLTDFYTEVGVGVRQKREAFFTYSYVTENFGFHTSSALITGVAFNDYSSGNNFYDITEGLAGVTISAQPLAGGAALVTQSGNSGGYSLAAPPGDYIVTASGGGLPAPIQRTVTVGAENVKVDFVIPPPPPDAWEPNDAFPEAAAIPMSSGGVGYVCSATIHHYSNHDYYRFVLTGSDPTSIDVHDDRIDGDLEFDIYDQTQQRIGSSDNGFFVMDPVTPGEYFVRVSGAAHRDYDLEINNDNNTYGIDDVFEPNDSSVVATPLATANPIVNDAHIRNYGDRDFYSWTAPASGIVDLQFSGSAVGRWQLIVENAGEPLATVPTSTGAASFQFEAAANARYYFAVEGLGCASFGQSYDLAISLRADPIANPDSAIVFAQAARIVDALENDSIDPLATWESVSITQSPAHGSAVIDPMTKSVTYTPAAGFLGFDTFSYRARDSYGASSNETLVKLVIVDPAVPWRNPVRRHDVNGDGLVTPLDALLVINELNARGPRNLTPPSATTKWFFGDVSGDNLLSALDPLLIINELNAVGEGEGEGPQTVESGLDLDHAAWWALVLLAIDDEREDD